MRCLETEKQSHELELLQSFCLYFQFEKWKSCSETELLPSDLSLSLLQITASKGWFSSVHMGSAMMVSELLFPSANTWNIDLLNTFFDHETVANILKIRIPLIDVEDKHTWT